MKEYLVKVTEKHVDRLWVKAETEDEAKDKAHEAAYCSFDSLYDCEIMDEREKGNE